MLVTALAALGVLDQITLRERGERLAAGVCPILPLARDRIAALSDLAPHVVGDPACIEQADRGISADRRAGLRAAGVAESERP